MVRDYDPSQPIINAIAAAETALQNQGRLHRYDLPVRASLELIAYHQPQLRDTQTLIDLHREITRELITRDIKAKLQIYSTRFRGNAGQTDLLSKSPQP